MYRKMRITITVLFVCLLQASLLGADFSAVEERIGRLNDLQRSELKALEAEAKAGILTAAGARRAEALVGETAATRAFFQERGRAAGGVGVAQTLTGKANSAVEERFSGSWHIQFGRSSRIGRLNDLQRSEVEKLAAKLKAGTITAVGASRLEALVGETAATRAFFQERGRAAGGVGVAQTLTGKANSAVEERIGRLNDLQRSEVEKLAAKLKAGTITLAGARRLEKLLGKTAATRAFFRERGRARGEVAANKIKNLRGVLSDSRTWTSDNGKFKLVASFEEYSKGEVCLHRTDGKIVSVPMNRLSKDDRKWVRDELQRRKEEAEDKKKNGGKGGRGGSGRGGRGRGRGR